MVCSSSVCRRDWFVAAMAAIGLTLTAGCGHPTDPDPPASANPAVTAAPAASPAATFKITGIVHEAAPTQATRVADARVEVAGGALDGQVFNSAPDGTFALPPLPGGQFDLYFKKAGYENVRYPVTGLRSDSAVDIGLRPLRTEVTRVVGGSNSCADIPRVSLRNSPGASASPTPQWARMSIHHDGVIRVVGDTLRNPYAAKVSGGIGQVSGDGVAVVVESLQGNMKHDTVIPVSGGFEYVFYWNGEMDKCRAWGVTLVHVN